MYTISYIQQIICSVYSHTERNYTVYEEAKVCEEPEDGTIVNFCVLLTNKLVFRGDSCASSEIKEVIVANET